VCCPVYPASSNWTEAVILSSKKRAAYPEG
jgi:hypothetical protein